MIRINDDKRTETHACDLIDRQAAIDAICKACACSDDYVDCIERRPESAFCDEMVALRKLPSVQPYEDMIHLQKEQAYMRGWEDGQKALREEIWERERDRIN